MTLDELPQPDVQLSRSWWIGYYCQRSAGWLLSHLPHFGTFLARIERVVWLLRRAAHSEAAYRRNKTRATGGSSKDTLFNSGYGYESEAEELRVAKMYKGDIASGQHRNAETPGLLAEADTVLSNLLQGGSVRQVVNFGVSYAYLDSLLAKKFPDVRFLGVDRSRAVCEFNSDDFKLSNLSFLACDINDWIARQSDLSSAVFFHMRTGILLSQNFLDHLYGKLTEKSVLAICGFEPVGVSRDTNTFISQSYEERPSVIFRDELYIHNYAGLCAKHGYKMRYLKYIKTAHIDRDVRMLSFVAQRPEQIASVSVDG